jgi:hypothetical protein
MISLRTTPLRTSRKWLALFFFVLWVYPAHAKLSEMNSAEMKEVIRLAKAISVVQPFLEEGKYLEYAWGIFKASQHYSIEPEVLISITEQETNFREDLPEGAAGERGICQIRKTWLKNKKFRKEFKKATVRDLHHPSKSFLFAAWILKGLKDQVSSNTLPYWSYYNSVKFENRMKYFLAVNKSIAALKRYEAYINSGLADNSVQAANAPKPPPLTDYRPAALAFYKPARPVERTPTSQILSQNSLQRPSQSPKRVASSQWQGEGEGVAGRWISDALLKIQQQGRSSEGKKIVPTSIMRTAQELGVSNFYNAASIQD